MSKTEQEARIAQVQSGLSAFQNPGSAPACKLLFTPWQQSTSGLLTPVDTDPAQGQESSDGDESSESEEE